MVIHVLGSAAGGGFPQWNCGCPNCRSVREGTIGATPRTQECIALSAQGERWVLLNASPEIRQQIERLPSLHPRAPRHSPIEAIVLTDGELDHCLGLLSLREAQRLAVYSTERVRRGFTEGNVLYRTLERFPGQLTWRTLKLGLEEELVGVSGLPTGLCVKALPVPGKVPPHLQGLLPAAAEDNVGLRIREAAAQRILAYLPAVGALTPSVRQVLEGADCVFFDGTFWAEDELPALGLGDRTARDMGHLPVGGAAGSLALLAGTTARRRIYIHLNNTNPLLRDDVLERAAVAAAGWEVAYDGMEVHV